MMNDDLLDEIRRYIASTKQGEVIDSYAYAIAISQAVGLNAREIQDAVRREAALLDVPCT